MAVPAQVSDFHFDGEAGSAARAARVIGYLADLPRPVDPVLVTGDIADHGSAAEYRTARQVLRSAAPVLANAVRTSADRSCGYGSSYSSWRRIHS